MARLDCLPVVSPGAPPRLPVQATGALAHLSSLPGGCPALLALPGVIDSAVRLLGSKIPDVVSMATMLLGVVSGGAVQGLARSGAEPGTPHTSRGGGSSGSTEAVAQMARSVGLLEALAGVCADGGNKQVQAYAVVALGNLALEGAVAEKVVAMRGVERMLRMLEAAEAALKLPAALAQHHASVGRHLASTNSSGRASAAGMAPAR